MSDQQLAVLRCDACGALEGAKLTLCRSCGAQALKPHRVAARGKLVSFTVVRRPGGAFAGRPPFAVALVDLECGLRLTANLDPFEPAPALDSALHLVGFESEVPVFGVG